MANKTIFITGSSTGLGKATTQLFAAKGWRVLATMCNPERESELADLPGVTLLPLDVTKPDQIEAAARRAVELGPVDVVFNNAGYGLAGPLEGTSDAQLVQEVEA
jgi:NAD(P)-dependent dehydrogenase (short-subunit alcohol dehydrogenase family)